MKAKNIVVAMDFSASAEAALQLATSLARDTGAVLHIVHVREPNAMYILDSHYGNVTPFPELSTLNAILEKVVPADAEVPYRHWLRASGNVSKEILKVAMEHDADLIMMGTHGRKGPARLLVGSVAESVIRHASCPVLTLKHPRSSIVEPVTGRLPS